MKEITLKIDKSKVYEEVAQTTSYTGAKMEGGDEQTYDRIFTTDHDKSQLERFWNESCVDVCAKLKKNLQSEKNDDEGFTLVLSLSSSFDETLVTSMEKELFSFFVMNIVAKWYTFTNKNEAGEYSVSAVAMLGGVHRKACFKKRPSRPTY